MTTLLKIFDLEIGKEYTFFFQVSSYDYNFCLKQIIEAYSRPVSKNQILVHHVLTALNVITHFIIIL